MIQRLSAKIHDKQPAKASNFDNQKRMTQSPASEKN